MSKPDIVITCFEFVGIVDFFLGIVVIGVGVNVVFDVVIDVVVGDVINVDEDVGDNNVDEDVVGDGVVEVVGGGIVEVIEGDVVGIIVCCCVAIYI